METINELQTFIETAVQNNVRGRLLDRGEARSIIRRAGILPEDAPSFAKSLDTDLSEYGFSLLRVCLALRENNGDSSVWRAGFQKAGNAFEALVRNCALELPQRGFWRVMGGASYHLAGFSAMAFSLLKQQDQEPNLAPAELAIVRLLLRDLESLRLDAEHWLRDTTHHDGAIQSRLTEEGADIDDVLADILNTSVFKAISFFEFGLQTGAPAVHEEALTILKRALIVAKNCGNVSLWWIIRVAINLIDDLWENSLHNVLPEIGPAEAENYTRVFSQPSG